MEQLDELTLNFDPHDMTFFLESQRLISSWLGIMICWFSMCFGASLAALRDFFVKKQQTPSLSLKYIPDRNKTGSNISNCIRFHNKVD